MCFPQVDVCGYRRLTLVMEWMGVHALMIYILAACNVLPFLLQGFYWGKPQNNIVIFSIPAIGYCMHLLQIKLCLITFSISRSLG